MFLMFVLTIAGATCCACFIRRGADKSLAFPISPTFILIILLSHQSLLFCYV
jgi:hypothetical protein